MFSTPNSNRPHIVFYGNTNVGKSSLLNKVLGQDMSIVSEISGTTTDPVVKAMEFIPVGPVVFIDTAGIDDVTELGKLRQNKTHDILKKTDLAIYVMDCIDLDFESYENMKFNFKKYNIPHILVINKIDLLDNENYKSLIEKYKEAVCISTFTEHGLEKLKDRIIYEIKQEEVDKPILGDLVKYDGNVVLVVPIDSEAPKGRLILPQVQCIRDCLDNGIKSYVVRDTELESALRDIEDIDLVITDSQAFKKVDKIVPANIKLTSFSILFARHKGELDVFIDGLNKIPYLNKNSKILIMESCSHNVSHEDIGRVKIPKLLNNRLGFEAKYDFKVGGDFSDKIEEYDLIIHCGGCMITRKNLINRISLCKEKNISITNYGVLIAYLIGILDRSMEIFKN